MTYQEATDYLFGQTPNYEKQGAQGYKEGLDTSLALDEHYGHPHRKMRCIHVAGTNGKGSVSHLMAAMLQVCGYRVGLYTSPHLTDFSERIRVNGRPIDEDYVVDFVERGREVWEPLEATFFEIATAMAFSYFADHDVDIAVVEVGLGGRLDCTNIITPVLSVITNISMDHTQLLGASLEQIAMEKGGIIKAGVPVVIGEATAETRAVFDALAQEAGAPIHYAEDEQEVVAAETRREGGYNYRAAHLGDFSCELGGDYQPRNMNTAVVALHQLVEQGYLCDCIEPENQKRVQQEMTSAFCNVTRLTGLRGRWQRVAEKPTIVCDTGHNTGAWHYLAQQLGRQHCDRLHIVFGMVEDKDIYGVMDLLPKNATYYYTKGSTKRAFPETSLKVFGDQFGLEGDCYATVAEAVDAARQAATPADFIFVGGSTYVVADFLKSCDA